MQSKMHSRDFFKSQFAKLIHENRSILFGAFSTSLTAKHKEDTWKTIQASMVAMGAHNFADKPWQKIRDHDWQYLRRSVVKKYDNGMVKSPSERPDPYTEAEQLVLDILLSGKDGLDVLDGCQDSTDSSIQQNGRCTTSNYSWNGAVDDEEDGSSGPDVPVNPGNLDLLTRLKMPAIKVDNSRPHSRIPNVDHVLHSDQQKRKRPASSPPPEEIGEQTSSITMTLFQEQLKEQRLKNREQQLKNRLLELEIMSKERQYGISPGRVWNGGDFDDENA